jgi:hypothetical protein
MSFHLSFSLSLCLTLKNVELLFIAESVFQSFTYLSICLLSFTYLSFCLSVFLSVSLLTSEKQLSTVHH